MNSARQAVFIPVGNLSLTCCHLGILFAFFRGGGRGCGEDNQDNAKDVSEHRR